VDPTALTAQLTSLDITRPTMVEYFKFVAPSGSSSTLDLSIQSSGLSLLAPRVWVYNSAETLLAYHSGLGNYGDTLGVTVNGITAGRTYYIRVAGADNTALGTGLYDLSLTLGSNRLPTVTLPNTLTPNGNPITTGGSMSEADGDAYAAPPSEGTITAPTSAVPPAFMLGLIEMGAVPLASADEWALHTLDHPTSNPQIKALAEHVVKLTASEEAHDPALKEELATGEVASLFPRVS
jgi:hypothetical protein